MDILQQHNDYRTQAENIVLAHFLQFDEEEKEIFFDFFRQICPVDSSAYQTLKNKYKAFQQQAYKFTHNQKYYLLLAMPKFLPTDIQFKLLRCELLDVIQQYHKQQNRHHDAVVYEGKVWDTYGNYINKLLLLQNYAFRWFAPNTFEANDQAEVITVIKYVHLLEAQEALQNFEKDLNVMRTHGGSSLSKLRYAERFFGFSVKATNTSSRQTKDYPLQDLVMPDLAGKFAHLLNEYIATHRAYIDQQRAENDVQESILNQDMATSIQHYEDSKSFLKKVDVSLQLQGRGGTITLETHKVPPKEVEILDDTGFEPLLKILLTTVAAVVGLPILVVLGVPFLVIAGIVIYQNLLLSSFLGLGVAYYWSIGQRAIKIESYSWSDLPDSVAEWKHDFDAIITEQKQHIYQASLQNNVWETSLMRLWQDVLESMTEECESIQNPQTALKVYKKCLYEIQKLKLKSYFDEIWEVTPLTSLEITKFLMKQQLQRSYVHYTAIVNEILEQNLGAELYIQALGFRITLYNFSDDEHKLSKLKRHQERIDNFQEVVSMPPAVGLLDSVSVKDWYGQHQQNLKNNDFDREFAQLRWQMFELKRAKKVAQGSTTPIFFESSEVIAYIF